jgi:hypothetical protein
MSGDVHVRICERLGVRFPRATRLICHCRSLKAAQALKAALEVRMEQCHLQLHPEKTRVVFCRDGSRRVDYAVFQFDFLGYRFRPRGAKSRAGTLFTGFVALHVKPDKTPELKRETFTA